MLYFIDLYISCVPSFFQEMIQLSLAAMEMFGWPERNTTMRRQPTSQQL